MDTHHNGFTDSEASNKDSEFVVDMAHKLLGTRDDCHSGDSLERATGHKRSASAGAEFGAWKIVIADKDIGQWFGHHIWSWDCLKAFGDNLKKQAAC